MARATGFLKQRRLWAQMMVRRRYLAQDKVKNPAIPFNLCPAKTFQDSSGKILYGRNVFQHCQIVGEVAKELLTCLPSGIRQTLFPKGSALVAACHDIGKVSPTFAKKLLTKMSDWNANTYPALEAINYELEKNWGGHAGVSEVAARALNPGSYIPEILGQHHGFAPDVGVYRADAEIFGGGEWQQQRELLVIALKSALNCDWPKINNFAQARAIAGLTSVSDWIGSGELFVDPGQDWEPRIYQSLDDAGFSPVKVRLGLSFAEVFGFRPHPAQSKLIEHATKPGVYILEAPMGIGKTEAALYAAYQLLSQELASGIYFALPTQLTSNKIYERFNAFLQIVLQKESLHHRSLLVHGGAWMLEEAEMGEEGSPGGAWFNSSKRGLLAPFAVGTIDQALMSVMNVKHGFVRAFGLAGKVVILDEVHTYDSYTGTILHALVDSLRQLHCTVIILSATLGKERRKQLLDCEAVSQGYPLVSALTNSEFIEESVAVASRQQIAIQIEQDDKIAVEEALDRAAAGQQVLWIENTVKEAQQRFFDLASRCAELDIDCGLLHSRFTAEHRQQNDNKWVAMFGKEGWPSRHNQGRVLVGTQVLEQSLDIDADFLISRFAPSDMLLQRLGRLWRHKKTPRHPSAVCSACILAPDLGYAIARPQCAFGSTAWVYSSYVLCRSLEVWQGRSKLSLPDDIRPVIDSTYNNRTETGEMSRWFDELEQGSGQRIGRQALRQLAYVTLAQKNKTLPESKAETRYSETASAEVLLLRSIELLSDRKESRLTLLDGSQVFLPWQRHVLNKSQWRKLSVCLMRQIVRVPISEAPDALCLSLLVKVGLQHCFYLGNPEQDEALLRLAIVDQNSELRGYQGASINKQYHISYRDFVGYYVQKTRNS